MASFSGRRITLFKNRVGPSVVYQDSLLNTLENVHSNFYRTCQLQFDNVYLSRDDIQACQEFMYRKLMTFHVHSPFTVNLASAKGAVVGNSKKSLNTILSQIAELDATCIVHCGSVGTLDQVVNNINSLNPKGVLLLENSAGEGTQLGSTIEEIEYLMSNITRPNIGLCIDTQHAFASGISSWDVYEDSMEILDRYNQIAPVRLIHLNDSKVQCGSRVDSHEVIGRGNIWSDPRYWGGLMGILDWCIQHNVDIVEETSNSQDSISFLRSML